MRLERRIVHGIPVVELVEATEIDVGNCAEFRLSFEELLDESDRQVVLDASSAEFFDSAGLGSLLSLRKMLGRRGGELIIAGPPGAVSELLRMVGFDQVFRIYEDVEEAVRAQSVSSVV